MKTCRWNAGENKRARGLGLRTNVARSDLSGIVIEGFTVGLKKMCHPVLRAR